MKAEAMRFGEKSRALRIEKGLGLRMLGRQLGILFACLRTDENGRFAAALDNNEGELLPARKNPEPIRRRCFGWPDPFLTYLNDDG
jgi:hypothetical protein